MWPDINVCIFIFKKCKPCWMLYCIDWWIVAFSNLLTYDREASQQRCVQCEIGGSWSSIHKDSSHLQCYVMNSGNFFNVYRSLHRNNILMYISNKMHMLQSVFYLTTALHVLGVTITHLQEHKTTITTQRTPPATHSNQFQLFHDSSRKQYGVTVTRCCS